MRYRRRGSPLVGVLVMGVILVVMSSIFVGLGIQEFHREHDKTWNYERVGYVDCVYDHTRKGTNYYECDVQVSGSRLIYTDRVQVTTRRGHAPPSSGTRWVRRVDGRVVDIGSKFPLWVEFFLLIPLTLFIIFFVAWRKSRRRKRAGYGGGAPTGFGAPTGYAPPGFGAPTGYAPPGFGQPVVTDTPQYPGPSGP